MMLSMAGSTICCCFNNRNKNILISNIKRNCYFIQIHGNRYKSIELIVMLSLSSVNEVMLQKISKMFPL